MKILNLGCGAKTSDSPNVINIDWSVHLRVKRNRIFSLLAPIFFNGPRLERFRALPDNILVHNLASGLPYEDESVDAVYHSHLLEHLDRPIASSFLEEIRRVLKPGGIQRIVVPDLEWLCRQYLEHISLCEQNEAEEQLHDHYIALFLDQCVRREAWGTSQQPPMRRFVENLVLGDARKRGETHQWMYDRINLTAVLKNVGFSEIRLKQFNTSDIQNWADYGLDVDDQGQPHKKYSLYIEAIK